MEDKGTANWPHDRRIHCDTVWQARTSVGDLKHVRPRPLGKHGDDNSVDHAMFDHSKAASGCRLVGRDAIRPNAMGEKTRQPNDRYVQLGSGACVSNLQNTAPANNVDAAQALVLGVLRRHK